MDIAQIVQLIAVIAVPLIFAITLHEAAHGWIASKLGDTTALMLGRVTLNPVKHIDPFGTIILPVLMLIISKLSFGAPFMFGWAKPVPVSWQNLNHPRRDMALVAVAGPGANLVMAIFWAIVAKLSLLIFGHPSTHQIVRTAFVFLHLVSLYGIIINILLLVLNLIPIPPLDGSRIVSAILPPNLASAYDRIEPYGIWIVLAVLIFAGRAILIPPIQFLVGIIKAVFGIS